MNAASVGRNTLVAAGIGVALLLGRPAHAALSDDDKKALVQMALQWAVDGGINDVKLMKDPTKLIVANLNLPKSIKLELPGRTTTVLSLLRIQAEANYSGDFLYFRFDRFQGGGERAKVAIALVWAVAEYSSTQYLSGGGATLDFEKRDGKWQLLPVMNRWMS